MSHRVKSIRFLALIILSGMVWNCKTTRNLPVENLKPLSASRIIRSVEENALDYTCFTIRRINCQYQDENEKSSFRANVKTIRNQMIVVSFNKLNIPFGRIMLTPDSVKYINYIYKNYFVGDYRFLKERFNIDVGFYDIQSVLQNNVFSFQNSTGEKEFRGFSSRVDSGRYVLQSVDERKLNKIGEKDKIQKAERIMRRLDQDAFIFQTITVLPGTFNVETIKIEDWSNSQSVEFEFGDYIPLQKKDYPGEITMHFFSEEGNIHLRIRMAGFSTDKIENINFTIPSGYERLRLR